MGATVQTEKVFTLPHPLFDLKNGEGSLSRPWSHINGVCSFHCMFDFLMFDSQLGLKSYKVTVPIHSLSEIVHGGLELHLFWTIIWLSGEELTSIYDLCQFKIGP